MMMRTERDGGEARRGRRGEEGEGHFLLAPSLGRISCSLFPPSLSPLLPPSLSPFCRFRWPRIIWPQKVEEARENGTRKIWPRVSAAAITKRACAPVPLDNNAAGRQRVPQRWSTHALAEVPSTEIHSLVWAWLQDVRCCCSLTLLSSVWP